MIRSLISALILIIGWVLALYGLIVAKAPDLKDEFDKIIPFQWGIWIILLIFWIIDFFRMFTYIWLLAVSPISGILALLALFTKLILWFVLSFWLITKYVLSIENPDKKTKGKKKKKSKKWEEDRKDKTNGLYKTLTYVQVPFGVISIILGTLAIVFLIIGLFS